MKLNEIKGIGDATINKLATKEIASAMDLIWYLPLSYQVYQQNQLIDKEKVILQGIITSNVQEFRPRKNLLITSFTVAVNGENLKVIAWNQRHLRFAFTKEMEVKIWGKWDESKNQVVLQKIEENKEIDQGSPTDSIVPVYSKIARLSNLALQKLIIKAIEAAPLEEELENSLLEVHQPQNGRTLQAAIDTLKYYEFKKYYLNLEKLKEEKKKADKETSQIINREAIAQFIHELPFELTVDQYEVVLRLLDNVEDNSPLQTLVLGDVGCGKTIVALIIALSLVSEKRQVAIMAPTEILARQIYLEANKYFPALEIGLLVGSLKKSEKNRLKDQITVGMKKLVVGTHALIEDDVIFKDLALAVIDEQHRFGVEQRNKLISKTQTNQYLYLCATPIPRTYALTFFDCLAIEKIQVKPALRQKIQTEVITTNKEKKSVYLKMEEEIAKGNQVYLVVPLIEEVEELALANIVDVYEKMKKNYPNYKIATLHGAMRPADKELMMERFKAREFDILIATTVIEVGVDVKDATTMIILDAQRYGLAQLHQLRGRVGRSEKSAYCYLLMSNTSGESKTRLNYLKDYDDGEKLAEIDMQIRGSGDFFGVRQSGSPDFKLLNIYEDKDIVNKVMEEIDLKKEIANS